MQPGTQRRCIVLCLILVAGLSVLSARLIQIQVVDRQKYSDSASSSYKRKTVLLHTRGLILDRNDELIASDTPFTSVYSNEYHLNEPPVAARSYACRCLREIVGKSEDDPSGKIKYDFLEPAVRKSLRQHTSWKNIPKEERSRMVSTATRLMLNNLKPEEIINKNLNALVEDLYRPLGLTKESLSKLLNFDDKKRRVALNKDMDENKMRNLEQMLKLHRIQGFDFEESMRREYPESKLATHTIGVSNHERKGVSGVEAYMNDYLQGRDGHQTKNTDVKGQIIAGDSIVLPPKNGLDVRLTLDLKIQAIVEEELQAGMDFYKCEKGAIVVMDPKTGEVLAMASRPHFDLNNREEMQKHGFNYAMQAANETGSTIKIVAAAAAVNEGKATYDTEVDCGWGIIRERGFVVKDHHPYGKLTLWQVLQKSSNPGAWQFAKMIGFKKFYEYAEAFGYGQKTGIELLGEAKGGIGNTGNPMDFSRCTYGYMLTASPLQIANAYSVLANNGVYVPAHIVKDVHSPTGRTVYSTIDDESKKGKTRRVLKASTAQTILKALERVTDDKGTARRARVKGYRVGGKTGTAHKVKNGRYMKEEGKKEYITSFAGVCPALEPDFVCVVVMDNPQLKKIWSEKAKKMVEFKRSGGSVAAPIFAKVVKRVAPLRGLKPNFENTNEIN